MSESIKTRADRQRKKNEQIYVLRYVSQATSTRLTAGAFATSFMLFIGLNTEKISVVTFCTNMGLFAASILVIFAYNWDKSGLGIVRWGSLGNALTSLAMLGACFLYVESLNAAYILLALLSFVGNTAYSMRNSAEINAVPMLFGRDRYAQLMGKCGYISGAVTLAVSLTTMFILKSDESIGYYRVYFTISSALMLLYAFLTVFLKRPADQERVEHTRVDYKKVFTKKYLIAALPHMTRGFGAAALALWPAAIMSHLDMTPLQNSLLIPIAIAADIIGSFIFVRLSARIRPGTMTMMSFIGSAVFMFITPLIRSVPVFFAVYIAYELMLTGLGKALTAALVYSCGKEELPLISSLHVLYYAIVYCPAVLVFGKLMNRYTLPCMLVAGIVYIISGIMWHFFFYKTC